MEEKVRIKTLNGYGLEDTEVREAVEQVAGEVIRLSEEIVAVKPQKFGAVGDGVTDDSDAIQAALNEGGLVYLPAGRYKITKTLTIGSNTTLMGDGDNSVIFLGDNGANLTPHDWYIDSTTYPQYYPYITTVDGASRIKISRIRIEGNTETASTNLHVGIAAESATDVVVEHVSVWKINYFPENAPARPSGQWRTGWNIAFLRSDRIELSHSTVQYGAYECVRIGTCAKNVWVHDCLIEYGWRTGLQVIEGCSGVVIERCTLNQDDFDAYDTNAIITIHESADYPASDITISKCQLNGKLYAERADGGGIHTVAGRVGSILRVLDTVINVSVGKEALLSFHSDLYARGCTFIAPVGVTAYSVTGTAKHTFVDCDIAALTGNGVNVCGNTTISNCRVTSEVNAIYAPDTQAETPTLLVTNCDIYAPIQNAVYINGSTAYDVRHSTLQGQIYINANNKSFAQKCNVSDNSFVLQPAKCGVKNDYSSTVYALLTICGNLITGGDKAVEIYGSGKAIIKDNDVSGCVNGINATNEQNIIKDNILPATN